LISVSIFLKSIEFKELKPGEKFDGETGKFEKYFSAEPGKGN